MQHKGLPVRVSPFLVRNELPPQAGLPPRYATMTVTPYPALFKLEENPNGMRQYVVHRAGYLLFKFQTFSQTDQDDFDELHKEQSEPQVFILGSQDVTALFELRPEAKIGLPFDQDSPEVVCIITHKRSFDGQMPTG